MTDFIFNYTTPDALVFPQVLLMRMADEINVFFR